MKRAKLRGLKRNAAVVLGNIGNADDVELLSRSLLSDEALVREPARWAVAKIGTPEALDALRASEDDGSP
jgi:epoxyqueuosine reductase